MADDGTIKIGADLTQVVAGFEAAEKSAVKFTAAVETGGKGAERAAVLLAIQIDNLEKQIAQLKAQGKPTEQFEVGLAALKGKLADGTAQLGRFRAAAADVSDATRKATQRAGEFSGSVTDVTGTLKTLSPALGNAIDKYSILAAKAFVAVKALQVSTAAAKELAIATGEYTGATKDAIDSADGFASSLASFDFVGAIKSAGRFSAAMYDVTQRVSESTAALGELADASAAKNFAGILKLQSDLVQGHQAETEALNKKAEALVREISVQKEAGGVQEYVKDALRDTLDAYAKIHEAVPPDLAEQAAALGVVSKEQEKAAESAAKLETVGVKSSQERAKAEQKAAEEIVAALAKEQQALADKLAQDEKALADKLAKGAKIDNSQDTTEARKNLDDLNKSIADLESQPLLSPDQLNHLDDLKNKARDAQRGMNDLNRVFTTTRDDFLTEAEAADAATSAWDVYRDRLKLAQFDHDRVMDSLDDASASFEDVTDSAGSAGDALDEFGSAAESVGDRADKGAAKGKEGLDKLTDGFNEALPLAKELRDVMQEIVSLGAQADI